MDFIQLLPEEIALLDAYARYYQDIEPGGNDTLATRLAGVAAGILGVDIITAHIHLSQR